MGDWKVLKAIRAGKERMWLKTQVRKKKKHKLEKWALIEQGRKSTTIREKVR